MEQIRSCTVDLTRIKGSGEFRCPSCGIEISPDDTEEEAYSILETVMKEDSLERIILKCKRCELQIHLIGFKQ